MKQVYPKIGIRPTIDGRQGGIREGLEEKTMNLAKAVKTLIESNLRNGDGSKVECVISNTTIGRVGESAACAEQFEREDVGSTITVTSCWCYGSETMDMNPTYPKAVWGFNGTERPGAVYLAAVLAAHAQKGLPAYGIYGHDVQDLDDNTIPEDVAEKILRFARAAQAVATMRGKSYLSLGNTCMGIAGSIVNADFLQQYLGMRTEYVSLVEILRRVDFGIYDKEEFEKAMQWVEKYCKPQEGHDYNEDRPLFPGVPMTTFNGKGKGKNRQEKDKDWEFTVKCMMIIRDLMQGSEKLGAMGYKEEAIGHNAIAAGVQGQRQWTDYKPNFDFPESMMCTSFDWNGPREAYTLATENDFLNGMSMLFGHLLTNRGVMFSDIRTYWSPEAVKRVTGTDLSGAAAGGFIHLINSGATTLDATGAMSDKDGYSSHFVTKGGMPMTMLRLNLVAGLGPVLQLAEGWTVELDPKTHDILDKRTDPTWPTTWFAPRLDPTKDAFKDVYSVMNNWGANHGAICYGHVGADLITLCAMLRIPVCMHNIADKDIFRPSCWNAFGMDKEGADYRACANFGPIYK